MLHMQGIGTFTRTVSGSCTCYTKGIFQSRVRNRWGGDVPLHRWTSPSTGGRPPPAVGVQNVPLHWWTSPSTGGRPPPRVDVPLHRWTPPPSGGCLECPSPQVAFPPSVGVWNVPLHRWTSTYWGDIPLNEWNNTIPKNLIELSRSQERF